MTVKELMTSSVCFVTADARISDTAALMKKYDVGMIPVCDSTGCLLGLITDRDIVLRLLCSNTDPDSMRACDIMSENITAVTSQTDIHDAACIFASRKVRRLPVLDNGRLVGILSLSDLSRKRVFLAEVGDIMGSIAKLSNKKPI